MNGTLTAVLLITLWGTVLVRLPTLWRDARQRALWATLCTLALAKTVATPGVNAMLDELVAQPQTLPHLIGVATGYFLLRFISLITDFAAGRPRAHALLPAAHPRAPRSPSARRGRGPRCHLSPKRPVAARWKNGWFGQE